MTAKYIRVWFCFAQMFEIPFFIAIDRTEKSIVVSIRGSLSVHVSFIVRFNTSLFSRSNTQFC